MDAELRRREHRERVGADPVEGDIAEVEEPGEADDDVQPQREQHVEQGVEADADDVLVRRHGRQQSGDDGEGREERRLRDAVELTLKARAFCPAFGRRDPFVDADPRPVELVRDVRNPGDAGLGDQRVVGHQTFCTAARPSSPLGRAIMTTIRMQNTTASENVVEM